MELEDQIGRADVIDISKLSGTSVKFGATVTLVDEDTERRTPLPDRGRSGVQCTRGPHLAVLARSRAP